MKPITFSQHSLEQMTERGASEAEVIGAIRTGERVPAKRGRQGYRKNFQYNSLWVSEPTRSSKFWLSSLKRPTR